MNVHDSEKMYGVLRRIGYGRVESVHSADLVIFNTCSIRQKAEQKFYSELGKLKSLKKRRPDLKIAVAGCVAQQDGHALFKRAPHVDFIIGPQNIHAIAHLEEWPTPYAVLDDNPSLALNDLPAARNEELKAWVTIMYGCDNFCSYCVVPYTRGRERSRPSDNILREVSHLSENGCREITLLGQNVNSYASDVDFAGLLRKVHAVSGIKRIRFVTSHPKDFSEDLMRTIADLPKVCEHVHLPLQSGSDAILKRMKRRYSLSDYRKKIDTLRRYIPSIAITSDIMTGFPGETDNDHMKTIQALKDIRFDGIFAFAFSARPQTAAARYPEHVSDDTKLERLKAILETQDEITLAKNNELIGSIQEILVEGPVDTKDGCLMGRTRTNKIVTIQSDGVERGQIVDVKIVHARKHSLEGTLTS